MCATLATGLGVFNSKEDTDCPLVYVTNSNVKTVVLLRLEK